MIYLSLHSMAWVGRDLKAHPVPPPAMGWVPPPAQAAQGPSMALGTSRDGAPTALWAAVPGPQHLWVKIFVHTSNINLSSFSLKLVLSLSDCIRSQSPRIHLFSSTCWSLDKYKRRQLCSAELTMDRETNQLADRQRCPQWFAVLVEEFVQDCRTGPVITNADSQMKNRKLPL